MRAIREGNSCLLSPGAPDSPVHHRTLSGADFFPSWRSRPLALWSRWRTGHCSVHTGQSGTPFRPLARPRVTRGLRGRPLARPTVGSPDSPVNYSHTLLTWFPRAATSPQPTHRTLSGAPPDSPVIYSRTPLIASREQPVDSRQPGAPDTIQCTTGHCLVHHRTVRCTQTEQQLAVHIQLFFLLSFLRF